MSLLETILLPWQSENQKTQILRNVFLGHSTMRFKMGLIFILFPHPMYLFSCGVERYSLDKKGSLSFEMKERGISGPVSNQEWNPNHHGKGSYPLKHFLWRSEDIRTTCMWLFPLAFACRSVFNTLSFLFIIKFIFCDPFANISNIDTSLSSLNCVENLDLSYMHMKTNPKKTVC